MALYTSGSPDPNKSDPLQSETPPLLSPGGGIPNIISPSVTTKPEENQWQEGNSNTIDEAQQFENEENGISSQEQKRGKKIRSERITEPVTGRKTKGKKKKRSRKTETHTAKDGCVGNRNCFS